MISKTFLKISSLTELEKFFLWNMHSSSPERLNQPLVWEMKSFWRIPPLFEAEVNAIGRSWSFPRRLAIGKFLSFAPAHCKSHNLSSDSLTQPWHWERELVCQRGLAEVVRCLRADGTKEGNGTVRLNKGAEEGRREDSVRWGWGDQYCRPSSRLHSTSPFRSSFPASPSHPYTFSLQRSTMPVT